MLKSYNAHEKQKCCVEIKLCLCKVDVCEKLRLEMSRYR